jgi:hypothetical protein
MKLFQHVVLKLLWSGIDILGKNSAVESMGDGPAAVHNPEVVTVVIRRRSGREV